MKKRRKRNLKRTVIGNIKEKGSCERMEKGQSELVMMLIQVIDLVPVARQKAMNE